MTVKIVSLLQLPDEFPQPHPQPIRQPRPDVLGVVEGSVVRRRGHGLSSVSGSGQLLPDAGGIPEISRWSSARLHRFAKQCGEAAMRAGSGREPPDRVRNTHVPRMGRREPRRIFRRPLRGASPGVGDPVVSLVPRSTTG